ncbi:MAG: cbb3-type cytochrome c oxidase subunit I [Sandaracinaceae bacterium]
MTPTLAILLFITFVVSVLSLLVLIWAIAKQQLRWDGGGAKVIFEEGELDRPEAPAAFRDLRGQEPELPEALKRELEDRERADRSSAPAVLTFLMSGVFWLLFGSVLGVVVALKFTFPDWLTEQPWLTFGRLRPIHLNTTVYGWLSMSGLGVLLWLLPRLSRTHLRGVRFAVAGAVLWNVALALGVVALAAGYTDGLEWQEIPWTLDILFVIAGGLSAVPLFATLRHRRVGHLYVSVWYFAAALVWFPFLFVVANWPDLHFGVEHAAVNWWFAHNVLGLWLTPIGLGAAYYLIPKVIGRPIYSYSLSLVGFWALALFYSQAGIHHLIGGPLPAWLVTLSIVQSVMMIIPVIAVAINHHMTVIGHFRALRYSPTLRFVVTGAVMYTGVSLIGSLMAVRPVNQLLHFTHWTVGHAHMGVYAFVSMVLFGAAYFMLPRLLGREWPVPALIGWHYWLSLGGVLVYIGALSIGGVLQGLAMLDPEVPFLASVRVTAPYLAARTVGGSLMTVAHLLFAVHVGLLATNRGPERDRAPWAPRALVEEVAS